MVARNIIFVGGPMDGQRRWHDGTKIIKVVEEPPSPPLIATARVFGATVEQRIGTYERDPADPYQYLWKGWGA